MSDHLKAPNAAGLLHLRGEALHKGEPIAPPITPASMFHLPGDPEPGLAVYGRNGNPTWEITEAALGFLEDAPALLFAGSLDNRKLLPADGYYVSRRFGETFLARFGVTVEARPTARLGEGGFEGVAAVLIESPSNPGLDLVDIAAVTAAVRAAGAVSIVDNTTMTPFGQRPLALGADIVVASDTKAPGGHSDLLMGHVSSQDEGLMARVREWRSMSGAIPSAFDAWLLHRSLETLELRFERMCDNAEAIAARLATHPKVRALRYPGLASDPGQALARAQMRRPGFLIGLTLESREAAERFIATCALITPATSFGGVHTSAERRARWGDDVATGFVRLAVGTEPLEPLWTAIDAALP